MPSIILRQLNFSYDGSDDLIFDNLNLTINTHWRACLVGANGRGKTTLLRLLAGELTPDRGDLERSVPVHLFPSTTIDTNAPAQQVVKDAAGPYRALQAQMEQLLAAATNDALEEYGVVLEKFQQIGGYEVDAAIERELAALDLRESLWQTPFRQLSGGEQTRCLLASLFLQEDCYPLIDEPTNHLDRVGRDLVASYLAGKSGFLLVSHDRAFLDASIDHVIALNPDTVAVQRTSFSSWRTSHKRQLDQQHAVNKQLKKEIRGFEETAQQRRLGAGKRESEKKGAADKGFVGARAARQMKRALAAELKAQHAAKARADTLTDIEKTYNLKLPVGTSTTTQLITANNLSVVREQPLFAPISFELRPGDRLAVEGNNGTGKSSLLQFLCGANLEHTGTFVRPHFVSMVQATQLPRWQKGDLLQKLDDAAIDETQFRQIMAALGVRGDVLKQPIESLSLGQQKKLDIARSLVAPADVLVWDEPLNYLDIDTRERLENTLLDSAATLIFCEHDAVFVDKIANKTIQLMLA